MAPDVRQLVLAHRPRAQQRHRRRRHGPVGHQGQGRRDARLRPVGRQVPRGGDGLSPRRRTRAGRGARRGPRLSRGRRPRGPLPDGRLRRPDTHRATDPDSRGAIWRPSQAKPSPARITTPTGTPGRRSSCSTTSGPPSVPTCTCSTTSTSGWRRSKPSGWRRRSNRIGCSSSRMRCRPSTWIGSAGSATPARHRSRWASCGSTRSNGGR